MSLPKLLETAVAGATLLQIAKQSQDYIAAATGHKGESLGTILGDIRLKRKENAEAVLGGAHLTLLNLGLKASEVPLRVLQPAMEGASLEDDPDLRQAWVNLLANAADPRELMKVHPSFPRILQLLSPFDARFLDAWREAVEVEGPRNYDQYELIGFANKAGLRGNPFQDGGDTLSFFSTIETLKSHGLITTSFFNSSSDADVGPPPELFYRFSLSALGLAFIGACQPPPPHA